MTNTTPRGFVDGIETETSSTSTQKFEFSPSLSPVAPPSPYPGSREHSEIKQSVSKLTEEVYRLSQELQEMTLLLKPLLQTAAQPILMTMVPNLTPPPSSASLVSTGASLTAPTPVTLHPLQRPDTHSLLDSGDSEEVDLPGCLLPTPHTPKTFHSYQSEPPFKSTRGKVQISVTSDLLLAEDELPDGSLEPRNLHASSSNGVFPVLLQDPPPPVSHTPSPSLSFSMSLSSSSSLSPCQGPHPSRPASVPPRTCLHPSHPDTPPPQSSTHCSAPPSLSSSPGDQRLRSSTSFTPLLSPVPSSLSLPLSLDFSVRTKQGDSIWCKSQRHQQDSRAVTWPQELEMHEWGRQVEEGRSSAENISFIDEEEPAL